MSHRRGKSWGAIVGVVLGMLALVAAMIYALAPQGSDGPVAEEPFTPAVPGAVTFPAQSHLDDVVPKLDRRVRPVTIAVLSDSTGAAGPGWVTYLGGWLGRRYDRTVVQHQWEVQTDQRNDAYKPDVLTLNSASTGTPITVWNGSAGGKGAPYSVARLSDLIPRAAGTPDLVIISHGHNEYSGRTQGDIASLISAVLRRYPSSTILLSTQNPEQPTWTHASIQADAMRQIREYGRYHHFQVVDPYPEFTRVTGWPKKLMDPNVPVHPNDPGYRLWAKVVENAFVRAGA